MGLMPVLQGALLCDAAHDYGGLVSILGGFVSVTFARQLPTPASIWFAGRVGWAPEELTEPHTMLVRATGPDGVHLGEVLATLTPDAVQRGAGLQFPELASGINLVFPFPFPLLTEGIHWVTLFVDDQEMAALPMKVILQPPAA